MISFTTGLTRWVDTSKFSVFLIVCIDCVGVVGNLIVGVRVCLATVIAVVVIAGTICVVLGRVFLSFELTAMVSVVNWLFAVVASLGFSGFGWWASCVTVLMCSSSGAYKPFNFNSPSRCDTTCSHVPVSKCAWLIVFSSGEAFSHI